MKAFFGLWDPVVSGHLAVAVRQYRERAERGAQWTPPELVDLEVAATEHARSRHDTTNEPLLAGIADDGAVALLLTKAQTAQLLGVSERTVDRLIADGDLPAVSVRGALRVRRSDADDYVDHLTPVLPAETKGAAA